MNNLISLAQAKQHLRILHNRDDGQIQLFIDAAVDNVSTFIDRPLNGTDLVPVVCDTLAGVWIVRQPLQLKPSLHAAALLICGDLYNNRDAQTTTELKLNPTLERLMNPYRKMGV